MPNFYFSLTKNWKFLPFALNYRDIFKESFMNPPVEPMSIKTHFFVRIIRYLLLIATMCPIAYFFFRDGSWGGFTLSILGIIFLVGGNH